MSKNEFEEFLTEKAKEQEEQTTIDWEKTEG